MGVKTIESEYSHLSDEEYLVARSKANRVSNPASAKCWMITAQLMFPDNADIKYEVYALEKEAGNAAEAAKALEDLIHHVGDPRASAAVGHGVVRGKLAEELDKIVCAIQRSDGGNSGGGQEEASSRPVDDDSYLLSIFDRLERETQQRVMLESASKRAESDVQAYGVLQLKTFERFPDLIPSHGAKFLNFVIARIKKNAASLPTSTPQADLGRLRDPLLPFLVMEMCPKLVTVSQLKLETPLLLDLLALVVDCAAAHVRELVAQESEGRAASSPFFSRATPGRSWRTIMPFMEEVGLRLGWELTEEISELSSDALFNRVLKFTQRNQLKRDDRKLEQFFSVAMLGFLKAVSDYETASQKLKRRRRSSAAHPSAAGGEEAATPSAGMGGDEETILVEAFVAPGEDAGDRRHQQSKRRKTAEDDRFPLITHGDSGEQRSDLIIAFQLTQEYYNLIRGEPEVHKRFQQVSYMATLLASFFPDIYLYWGSFRDALHVLRLLPSNAGSTAFQCRRHIRMATIQFCLGDHVMAADHFTQALAFISALPDRPSSSSSCGAGSALKQATSTKTRHVHFLPFTKQHVLAYICRVLVYVLKDKCLQPMTFSSNDDAALGHVIVLLQYVFPEEKDLFFMLLQRIRVRESFTYPLFCSYVVHVEFLEEFAYLLSDATAKVALDITPTAAGGGKRMGTRGANRGEKEEIRAALKKQVLRSHEPLDNIIEEFLLANRDSIVQSLT